MSQGMTPEFVLGYRAMMLDGIAREAECTKKVIAAVPDAKSDYRPDPHARTAKQLAWHLANSDIQFLDGIADGKFSSGSPENKPQTSAKAMIPESGTRTEAIGTPCEAAKAMVCLAKCVKPAVRKISTKSRRPRNTTGAAVEDWILDAGMDCASVAMEFS